MTETPCEVRAVSLEDVERALHRLKSSSCVTQINEFFDPAR